MPDHGVNFGVSDSQSFSLPSRDEIRVKWIEHHPHFGRFLAPEGLTDIVGLLEFVTANGRTGGWRGQASLQWRIDSGLARRVRMYRARLERPGVAFDLAALMRTAEERLLSRARLAGHGERDGRTLHDLELLAVLQHHGAATRLLDCTSNVFVALWFACGGAEDEYGLLAGFDLGRAHRVTSRDLSLEASEVLDTLSASYASWRPSRLSPRIPAQQGLFVFSEAVDKPWGSIAFDGEAVDATGDVPGLKLFGISPALKRSLRQAWSDMFGYTEESLFPDVDGFARVHSPVAPFPDDYAFEDV